MTTKDTIPDLLLTSVSRELLLGVEDALVIGAKRAHAAASGMHEGHYPHVLGQLRHFHMNETFQRALATSGASPTPIRGNGIVFEGPATPKAPGAALSITHNFTPHDDAQLNIHKAC